MADDDFLSFFLFQLVDTSSYGQSGPLKRLSYDGHTQKIILVLPLESCVSQPVVAAAHVGQGHHTRDQSTLYQVIHLANGTT